MDMQVPSHSVRYILYQRTGLDQRAPLARIARKVADRFPALYKPLIGLRALVHRSLITHAFVESIRRDYEQLAPFLPALSQPTIIDIGCGIAGIDALLSKHYAHQAQLYLVDRTHTDSRIWYKFAAQGSFYNDFDAARDFLLANQVPPAHIHCRTPEAFLGETVSADIVISLLSWGWHYPLAIYLEKVVVLLHDTGVLIVDIRRDTDGLDELKKRFSQVQVIGEDKRGFRVVARK